MLVRETVAPVGSGGARSVVRRQMVADELLITA